MTTRLRVRDLATELDISSKDLMTILRELKIPAKSQMSGLTSEEVEQIQAYHKNRSATPQIVDTRSNSGVIVRKRSKDAAPRSAQDGAEPAEAEITVADPTESREEGTVRKQRDRKPPREASRATMCTVFPCGSCQA